MNLGRWFGRLSPAGKAATVGAAGVGAVLAARALGSRSGEASTSGLPATAGCTPATGQLFWGRRRGRFYPVPGVAVGDWYARMRTRYRVRMFGPWRLYRSIGGSPWVVSDIRPGGEVIEVIAPAFNLRIAGRSPRERLYLVQVIRRDGERGPRGYAFVSPALVWA